MTKVIDKLFNSIVFRIGSMMFLISMVAIFSMFSSMFISELADHDALAINHAGSIRMQSYKILSDFEYNQILKEKSVPGVQSSIESNILELDHKLKAPVLHQAQYRQSGGIIAQNMTDVDKMWRDEVHPMLLSMLESDSSEHEQLIQLKQTVDRFVDKVDHLVSLLQHNAEQRILLIRMIQGGSLMLTITLVVVIMIHLSRRVEKPLSELTSSAKQIINGDYTAHTHIQQNDELGFLSKTMNQMADAVSQSHLQLEKRVIEKTSELRKSNDSLEILYEVSMLLSKPGDKLDLAPITNKLSKISGLEDIDLCLMTNEGSTPYEHIMTADRAPRDTCVAGDCSDCVSNCDSGSTVSAIKELMTLRYPLMKDSVNYGVLVCSLNKGSSLESWQHQLLQSVTTQIATGLHLRQQTAQHRRYTLTNERTVIARELHDSLAQALSYLKFQVTRLQKLRQKDAKPEQIDAVVDELKTGLSSAYRQLRELLTTFRLKIDDDGLKTAFEKTLDSLNERAEGRIQFNLDYQIGDLPLTPNEEIHLMQIAREATQNVLHHSQATQSNISVFADESRRIHLVVEDNGIGIPDNPEKLNHYGMAIMQERSVHLGGEVNVSTIEPSGTRIELVYLPSYVVEEPRKFAV